MFFSTKKSFLYIAICCSLLSACTSSKVIENKLAETAIERETGGKAKVDSANNSIEFKDNNGSFSVNKNNLDEIKKHVEIPDWMKSYDGNNVMKVETSDDLSMSAQLLSDKNLEETKNYWLEYLKKKDFKDVANISYGQAVQLTAAKDNNTETLAVTLDTSDAKKVTVNLVYIKHSSKPE